MHTFEWTGTAWSEEPHESTKAPCKVIIHHDGDFGGNVTIEVPTWVAQQATRHFSADNEDHHIAEMKVPYEALKALVMEQMRKELIADLENLEEDALWELLRQLRKGLIL